MVQGTTEYTILAAGMGLYSDTLKTNLSLTINGSPITGTITLSQTSYIGNLNTVIPNIIVTTDISSNSTVVFNVNPSLPAGLTIDTITGEISGTPTAVQEATEYTISTIGTGLYSGTLKANLSIKINTPISGSIDL